MARAAASHRIVSIAAKVPCRIVKKVFVTSAASSGNQNQRKLGDEGLAIPFELAAAGGWYISARIRCPAPMGEHDSLFIGNLARNLSPANTAPGLGGAAYFTDLFWDGRADDTFNGVNPFGHQDPDARIFVSTGFSGDILVFESGIDALQWMGEDESLIPTCIFLDINMPMMDGFEVAENAEPLIGDKPTTVLVMLTSSGSPADKERALAIPVIQDYVTKPLSVDLVKQLLSPQAV